MTNKAVHTPAKRKKRRVMKDFRINEISLVDRPAQPTASITIMKRDDSEKEIAKGGALTTSNKGHSHIIDLFNFDGERSHGDTRHSLSEGEEQHHSHPWIKMEDGTIVIGEAEGHSHAVDVISKSAEEPAPAGSKASSDAGNEPLPGETMTPEELAKQAEDLKAANERAERAEKLAELNDAQKAEYAKRNDDDKAAWLALSADDREAFLKNQDSVNPIVFEHDGIVLRADADPALLALAKRNKQMSEQLAQGEAIAKAARLAKQADELQHLPGERTDHLALLEAIENLPVEKRDAAMTALKAQNESLGKAFQTVGVRGEPKGTGDTPEAKLETLAKSLRQKDPKLTEAQAMVLAMDTPEGRDLYNEHVA